MKPMDGEARWSALMVSSYHRTAKLPREQLRSHIVKVLVDRGVTPEDAQREAELVWISFWQHADERTEEAKS